MSAFNLEKRAEELWPGHGEQTYENSRADAIRLARELAEAIAAEIESTPCSDPGKRTASACAYIARSYARPRTRENVLAEALAQIETGTSLECAYTIARAALDWRPS